MGNVMKFQYYADNVKTRKPQGSVYLDRLVKAIRTPNKSMAKIYNEISKCESIGDMKRKAELKKHLYFFIAPTYSDGTGRAYKNIISFTGALQLDFDHIEDAARFRDDLFNEYTFIIASWLSASKKGVKALVSIPISANVKEFQQYFWGLAVMEMMKYKGFDKSPQNAVLPLFISHDPDIKYRDNFTTWSEKGENPSHKNYGKTTDFRYKIETNEKYSQAAISNTIKSINKIISDGHPQVRGAAVALGGYVGAGYLDYTNAETLITELIKSNAYLSKGTAGYIKTAVQMMNKGMKDPLYFNF